MYDMRVIMPSSSTAWQRWQESMTISSVTGRPSSSSSSPFCWAAVGAGRVARRRAARSVVGASAMFAVKGFIRPMSPPLTDPVCERVGFR